MVPRTPDPAELIAAPRLSATVLAKNEAANLPACLEALSFCDEIVVLDNGSTDETAALARAAGANVLKHEGMPGFGTLHNMASDAATGDWILVIDADERVTPELASEIRQAIATPGAAVGFNLPRLSSYCGQYIRHSGWWPDLTLKLYRKGKGRFTDVQVHERVEVDGPVGRLDTPLLHHTYPSLRASLDKLMHYAELGGRDLKARGKTPGLLTAWARGAWAFIKSYVLRQGFRDGRAGFLLACGVAFYTFYKYIHAGLLAGSISLKKDAPSAYGPSSPGSGMDPPDGTRTP
jgi:glycosyltransferase involved in cell wall biosynthesis